MSIRFVSAAALVAMGVGIAGTASAQGSPASSHYNAHCGEGGWDAPGGGIPTGCQLGEPISSYTTPLGGELPNAQPGQCFARIVIPAVYEDVPQTVTTHAAYDKLSVNDATFAPDTVSVKVKDESVKYVVREARFATEKETVMVKPAYDRLTVVPAKFEFVSETVVVGKPRLVWRPGKNLSGVSRKDPHTGAVYCLVEEPGKKIEVQKRVVAVPEQVKKTPVPAQFKDIAKLVLVDPGGVDKIAVPAEYKTVDVERLASPAGTSTTRVAEQTKTIMTRVLVSPERFQWAPVLCDSNATHSSISRIQAELASAGHYNGAIDGIAGPQTQQAIKSYQEANGLPVNGILTADTLASMGLGDMVGVPNKTETSQWQAPTGETAEVAPQKQVASNRGLRRMTW